MSLRTPLAALVAAASLAIASPAFAASSTVSSPADGATFAYDAGSPPTTAVSGTADVASVDLRCATKQGSSWHFDSALAGGSDVAVAGGAFTAPSVTLPVADGDSICRLVAVPHGITPPDLSGPLAGPALRLLIVRGTRWNHGGIGNDGKLYDYFSTAGGTVADSGLTATGDGGLEFMDLLSSDPGEQGELFSGADRILDVDPTAPSPTISGDDGPLTGILVDGVNAFTGPSWNQQVTPSLQIPFRDLLPFPSVATTPALAADRSFTVSEHDVVVSCHGSDSMWYPPQGATCSSLGDAGVQIDLVSTISPSGNVIERRWSIGATDGRPHTVKLWLAHTAGTNAMTRAWKLPGDAGFAARSAGSTPAVSGPAPWIARFDSVGAADGDVSEGVGAFGVSVVPTALRFRQSYDPQAEYTLAVPASGAAQLRSVYVGASTQAAVEAALAAAFPPAGGGGGGGGGAGGAAGTAPALSRTGKALLGLTGKLSLGYSLACPGDAATSCSASVALTQPVRRAARRHGAKAHHAKKRRAARRAKPRVLGTLKVTVASGRTTALTMTIARRYRAAFKAGHITMTARLDRTGVATQTVVKPLPVKIAKPKPSRRGHHRR